MRIPLTKPSPPRLSQAASLLREIEERGIYSNFGPVNTAFETQIVQRLFNGKGYCTTVCNATLGLMIAVRRAIDQRPSGGKRYALMPSFTFAAAAQAAIWCGLTPLLCDIDPVTWAADPRAEEALLRHYGDDVAVIMPYATFGYDIDLARYDALSARYGIPVVVDAAASLGTISANGEGFGAGSAMPIVFSMHATKSFSTGEGGLIYSADKDFIDSVKVMSNFGFGLPRNATMLGLNAKMSEVGALTGLLRLDGFERLIKRRQSLVDLYRNGLPDFNFQPVRPTRQAHQFFSSLLPAAEAGRREEIRDGLAQENIGSASYFSPHLGQQDYFRRNAVYGALPVADDVASRIISLPLFDTMKNAEVLHIVAVLRRQLLAQDRFGGMDYPDILAAD